MDRRRLLICGIAIGLGGAMVLAGCTQVPASTTAAAQGRSASNDVLPTPTFVPTASATERRSLGNIDLLIGPLALTTRPVAPAAVPAPPVASTEVPRIAPSPTPPATSMPDVVTGDETASEVPESNNGASDDSANFSINPEPTDRSVSAPPNDARAKPEPKAANPPGQVEKNAKDDRKGGDKSDKGGKGTKGGKR